ncbi:MAG: LptF/LptG family permease [Planctomycetota bacterium]
MIFRAAEWFLAKLFKRVLITLPLYVLRELARAFFPALLILSFAVLPFFLGGLLRQNVGLLTALAVAPFLFPFFSGQVIPPAILVGTVLCYSRLGSENEYAATQASGVRPGWMWLPAFAVGLVSVFFTLYLNESVLTFSTQKISRIILSSRVNLIQRRLAYQGKVKVGPYHIYRFPEDKEGRHALDITEYDRPPKHPPAAPGEEALTPEPVYSRPVRRVVAQDHAVMVQPFTTPEGKEERAVFLVLKNCFIETLDPKGPAASQMVLSRETMLPLPVEAKVSTLISRERVSCWGIGELLARLQELRSEAAARKIPEDEFRKSYRKVTRALQTRLSLSFSCLLFALAGAFLGLVTQHGDRTLRFGLGFAVFAAYFLLFLLCRTLADSEGWILWLPNLLLAALALHLWDRMRWVA